MKVTILCLVYAQRACGADARAIDVANEEEEWRALRQENDVAHHTLHISRAPKEWGFEDTLGL